ncbi:uncharacterized protein LOC122060686 [Macadamia integrifolia]|uniref:uncharacterized protein LOC122060686 n=1 Tax=Macadamia integrifolia TaxID=60698 RepID=UPI001C532D24|nr:uncharacterized protein LOC122060686 [Macadamia integrifolia]
MDIIGKIYTPSQGHSFVLVETDSFTKWVEAIPLKVVNQTDVIKFLKQHIIHRFGLPETITCDNGSVFTEDLVLEFAKEHGIAVIHLTPYYAQGNGQVETSNKVLKSNLAKVITDNPSSWAKLLSEITVKSLRVARQHNLMAFEYSEAILTELEDLSKERVKALNFMQVQKVLVAKAYDKRVRPKEYERVSWYGRPSYQLGLRLAHLVNGPLRGKDHLKYIKHSKENIQAIGSRWANSSETNQWEILEKVLPSYVGTSVDNR